MRYPERLLSADEEMLREFHPHWRVLLPAFGWDLLGLAAIVAGWVWFGDRPAVAWTLSAVGLVLIVGVAGLEMLRWKYTLYVLTTERLIVRAGIISRMGTEIPLENVNDVRFSQTPLERVLGYGDVVIESAGELGQSHFTDIPGPERFQSEVYTAREERMLHLEGDGERDPVAQLESLARLRDEGAISEKEYEDGKRRLLGQL